MARQIQTKTRMFQTFQLWFSFMVKASHGDLAIYMMEEFWPLMEGSLSSLSTSGWEFLVSLSPFFHQHWHWNSHWRNSGDKKLPNFHLICHSIKFLGVSNQWSSYLSKYFHFKKLQGDKSAIQIVSKPLEWMAMFNQRLKRPKKAFIFFNLW